MRSMIFKDIFLKTHRITIVDSLRIFFQEKDFFKDSSEKGNFVEGQIEYESYILGTFFYTNRIIMMDL